MGWYLMIIQLLKKFIELYGDRVLTFTLVIIALAGLGGLGYVIATPKMEETFTEFYILDSQGQATDYPDELQIGDEGRVILGIINHEQVEMSYRVEVLINSMKSYEIGPVVLENEEKWEAKVGFVTEEPGEKQKVEFLLYEDSEDIPPLESLYLWINVSE
jgi:uncharacterized membrane protein